MGPLVPYGIIGSEFNFIIALVLGFFFGYILENAGFSSSRKLVGVFYGYDFVVLKVFFTAAVTAALGLVFMGYFGWIDLSVVYVNPLYLWPALVGGAIMGVGFLLGGFCPGTSITAASIGRLDAMIFIGGIMIGVFIFGENFSWMKDFYVSGDFGAIKVYESLGISRGLFIFLLVIVALAAFAVTANLQKKIAPKYNIAVTPNQEAKKGIAIAGVLILAAIAAFIPENKQARFYELSAEEVHEALNSDQRFVDTDKVAFHMMHNVQSVNLQLIDVRSKEEFDKFTLPGATHAALSDLTSPQVQEFLLEESEEMKDLKVFFSNDNIDADKAWMLFKRMGYDDFVVLKGGLNHFVEHFFHSAEGPKPVNEANPQAIYDYRFKNSARDYFQGLEKEVKTTENTEAPVMNTITVSGGC